QHDRKELAKSGIILETMYVYECPKDAYLNSTHWETAACRHRGAGIGFAYVDGIIGDQVSL
ncbi:MAG: hypothetical protein EZS28_036336, partial [Streblomastix strix]